MVRNRYVKATLVLVILLVVYLLVRKDSECHDVYHFVPPIQSDQVMHGKQPQSKGASQNDQVGYEPSFTGDHPKMVYFRKYVRVKNLPSDDEMKGMGMKELTHIYHGYLDNTDYLCKRKLRLGKINDGGYETCDDYQYRPISPCLVYSFGIRNDFSFDDEVAKLYGCQVFSFDPSMKQASFQRSDTKWFYKIGLGGSAHQTSKEFAPSAMQTGWEIKTLKEIKAMLHHENRVLDILKMDIEASEWLAFEDMMSTGELSQVRQLLVEIHRESTRSVQSKVSVLQKIESMGFRRFRTRHMPSLVNRTKELPDHYPVLRRICCYEMGFVNERMARDLPTV